MKPASHVFTVVVTVQTDEDGEVVLTDESWEYVGSEDDEGESVPYDDPSVSVAFDYTREAVVSFPEC